MALAKPVGLKVCLTKKLWHFFCKLIYSFFFLQLKAFVMRKKTLAGGWASDLSLDVDPLALHLLSQHQAVLLKILRQVLFFRFSNLIFTLFCFTFPILILLSPHIPFPSNSV